VYLADVGFRSAGVRLVMPVRAALAERRLTLDDLIATLEGTELTYHLSGLIGDEGYTSRQDIVAIRIGDAEQVLERGAFSFKADAEGLRRRLSSTSVIPQWSGPVEIAIAVMEVGEFRLAAAVSPFGPNTDASRHDVNTSVTHEGITVSVGGIGAAREETAVEVEVAVGDGECCRGIGGYEGHRLGPTTITLSDQHGRVYRERWQEPGRLDHATLALFDPLHPDARELELSVPYVFVEEPGTTEAIPLPVKNPVDARLGRYPIRVLATSRVEADPRARLPGYRRPALGVDIDLGGWQGDRRVVLPGRILVDGDFLGVASRIPASSRMPGGMFNATRPEPLERVELTDGRSLVAKTLGFSHPCIQVRGPWRIRFPLL